ncbi:hypothetical protein [Methanothrix sp.]|jgi:hypothetical protein
MRFTDIDWRAVLNDFSEADLIYLRSMIDEKISQSTRRKVLICGERK